VLAQHWQDLGSIFSTLSKQTNNNNKEHFKSFLCIFKDLPLLFCLRHSKLPFQEKHVL
jgi:hypothetical protein